MVIALLTDFGSRDGFVGAMKGAALAINPDVRFVDVSHEIGAHAVLEGALVLASVFDAFAEGTIFVAVVDPGVGGDRRVLAARAAGRTLLAPDNGLISPVLSTHPPAEVRSVVNTGYFRSPPHPTFHGRDVFAPVAAHLSLGVSLAALGPEVADPVRLEIPRPRAHDGALVGEVLHVDRFGNLVTSLTEADIASLGGRVIAFEIAGRVIEGISATYSVGASTLKVVVGSWGFLEVVLRDGDAARALGAGVGTVVRATAGGIRA